MRNIGDPEFTTWSGSHEPYFEQVELGTTEHLPLDHFESVDMALGGAIAELYSNVTPALTVA